MTAKTKEEILAGLKDPELVRQTERADILARIEESIEHYVEHYLIERFQDLGLGWFRGCEVTATLTETGIAVHLNLNPPFKWVGQGDAVASQQQ